MTGTNPLLPRLYFLITFPNYLLVFGFFFACSFSCRVCAQLPRPELCGSAGLAPAPPAQPECLSHTQSPRGARLMERNISAGKETLFGTSLGHGAASAGSQPWRGHLGSHPALSPPQRHCRGGDKEPFRGERETGARPGGVFPKKTPLAGHGAPKLQTRSAPSHAWNPS